MSTATVLMVPGLTGSGDEHWQTLWERSMPNAERIEQADYDRPNRKAWLARIAERVAEFDNDVVLVGHSLGAIAIATWAARDYVAIRGALLVAPTDLDRPDLPRELQGWSPIPMIPLPFPSVVVASSNDPWVSIARAQAFANAWQGEFVDAGPIGHINTESKLGMWPQGRELLDSLLTEY